MAATTPKTAHGVVIGTPTPPDPQQLFSSRHENLKRDLKGIKLEEQMKRFLTSVTMNDEDLRLRQHLLEDLLWILKAEYKDVQLFPFGSLVSGLGDKDSDLDVVADCIGKQHLLHFNNLINLNVINVISFVQEMHRSVGAPWRKM